LEVSGAAKPHFPVEYLLVTVITILFKITHGYPMNPTPVFKTSFGIENRVLSKRDMSNLKTTLSSPTLEIFSDFHLLYYVQSLNILDAVIFSYSRMWLIDY
jgi:hypothetical protein